AEALIKWRAAGSRTKSVDEAAQEASRAEARVRREEFQWHESLGRVRSAEAALAALAARPEPENHLLPGDVLLIRGDSFVSGAIRLFEQTQFGRPLDYSHAALYLGEVGGQKHMVAEMLGDGFNLHPLKASMKDDNIVDAYRWKGQPALTPALRQVIVNKALGFRGKKYGWAQLDLLRVVAGLLLPGERFIPLQRRASLVDVFNRGELRIICSEMVSWSYHHAGLDPDASEWWPTLGVLLTDEVRRHDYTTPNTIAVSTNFYRLVRLKPQA
ncbi:MAG: hypothetical protein LC795_16355, partial [Acidobacteria bacterium]|nr:hypothetical protein [Acidobacteriota bacterium]